MTVQIRPATVADAAEIGRLYQQSAAYLRSLGDTTDYQFSAEVFLRDGFGDNGAFSTIVAVEDGIILGYLIYQFMYDTDRALRILYVLDLLIDSEVRGKGIGTVLMNDTNRIAKEKGAMELQWVVYIHNRQAMDFYEKWGGELIEDILHMRRTVS
jgi:ribosomal protein S18 acetylase RimI-like enzyme